MQQQAERAISFARGLRYENWPMVAEFVNEGEAVWVNSYEQAKALQDAIHNIGGRTTRLERDGQWKVIRLSNK